MAGRFAGTHDRVGFARSVSKLTGIQLATRVTLALERYDRHVPFFLEQLSVPSHIDLVPLEVGMVPPRRHGVDRHGRMLRDQEFDAGEVSLASYIIAKSRGAPFTAIPVFPRRLFSQNHIFVSEKSRLNSPAQLSGKRVIIWAFQVTMSVLAKGDMQRDYGLNWRSVNWLTLAPEEITVPNLPIRQLEEGTDPVEALLDGRAEAFINPHPPEKAMSRLHGIRRLFRDPVAECEGHFGRHGFFPIMHLIAIKNHSVDTTPDLPLILFNLWEEAKTLADDFYHDPGYGLPAFLRLEYERQREQLGMNIWPSGLKMNRNNLEQFMENMVDQNLIPKPLSLEQMFHPSALDT